MFTIAEGSRVIELTLPGESSTGDYNLFWIA